MDNSWIEERIITNESLQKLVETFKERIKPGANLENNQETITESECFKFLFTEDLIKYILDESNIYMKKKYKMNEESSFKNFAKSSPAYIFLKNGFELNDIYSFLAIKMIMGIIKLPDKKQYWSSKSFYRNEIISNSMSLNFFKAINTALHFEHNDQDREDLDFDPRYKLGKLLKFLEYNFKKNYIPDQKITIDETMVGFTGKNKMKFYIPTKPTKWGFKIHILSESKSGYCLSLILDPGKEFKHLVPNNSNEEIRNLSDKIVLNLLDNNYFKNKGYCLYLDSWYTSPSLLKKLMKIGIGCTGMVKENRKEIPKNLCDLDLELNENKIFSNENGLNLILWQDKKKVKCLTTIKFNKVEGKPEPIFDYGKNMHGVDILNLKTSYYTFKRKYYKWYKYIFFHMIEICIVNAHIIFESIKKTKITILNFRENLIHQLLEGYSKVKRKNKIKIKKNEINHNHFPIKGGKRNHCLVCRNNIKIKCDICEVYLCLNCFKDYHS